MDSYVIINDCVMEISERDACAERALREIMRVLPEDARRVDVITEVIDAMKLKLQMMQVVWR